MKSTKFLGLLLLFALCGGALHAADCSGITDTEYRFNAYKNPATPNPYGTKDGLIGVISAAVDPGEGEILTDEIRRPDQMGLVQENIKAVTDTEAAKAVVAEHKKVEDKPRMSVGIWIPFVEPAPVVRLPNQQLDGKKAKIFKAKGSSDFDYVVKALVDDAAHGIAKDKFYVFKDVKYAWTFEKDAHDEKYTGNEPGTSGVAKWSPFLAFNKTVDEAKDFLPLFGDDKSCSLTEKKVYANHHTTAYDTGISSVQSTSESSILQAVMMTLSYKMAEVQGTATGNGYPEAEWGTSDSSDGIPAINGEFEIAADKLPAAGSFTEVIFKNPVPAEYGKVLEDNGDNKGKKMWPDVMGEGSAYKLVYVEDYKEPDTAPVPYTGGDAGKTFYKATVGGTLDRSIQVTYAMPNPNLNNVKSDEAGAKLKYYIGNGDIYRVDNPFFGNQSFTESYDKPYLNFFYMAGNDKFGPYTCPVPLPKIKEWYTKKHPYWSTQPGELANKFVSEKLRNAFPSDSLPKWHMGVVFFLLNTDGSGKDSIPLTKALNAMWRKIPGEDLDKGTAKFNAYYSTLESVKDTNPAAKYAYECVTELKKFIDDPQATGPQKYRPPTAFGARPAHAITVKSGDVTFNKNVPAIPDQPFRTFFRFALTGYDPMQGSFCVGPQDLEKDNKAVIYDWVEKVDDQEIKVGEVNMHKERMVMPVAFSNESMDYCSTDCYNTKQTVALSVGGCCGAITTVTPGIESDRKGTEIVDNGGGVSLPVPQLSIADSGGEKNVSIPSNFELQDGQTLLVIDKATNQPCNCDGAHPDGQYAPHAYSGQFDATKYDFKVIPAGGNAAQAVPVAFNDGGAPGDMIVNEDERIAITTGGYDNVDRGSRCMGIGQAEIKIFNTQTNQYETLEYVAPDGTKTTDTKITVAPKGTDVKSMFEFDPKIQLYHIFREPGNYKAEYTVWETAATKKSRTLSFNILVKDIKQQNRAVEQGGTRQ